MFCCLLNLEHCCSKHRFRVRDLRSVTGQQRSWAWPPPPSSSVTSVNSGAATGDKNSIPEVKPTKTGLDNVVDKVAEVTPQVVEPIASNTKEVINHVSDNIESGTTKVVNNFWNQTRTIIISVIAIIVLSPIYLIISLILTVVFNYAEKKLNYYRG